MGAEAEQDEAERAAGDGHRLGAGRDCAAFAPGAQGGAEAGMVEEAALEPLGGTGETGGGKDEEGRGGQNRKDYARQAERNTDESTGKEDCAQQPRTPARGAGIGPAQ